jgi:hypothetical protein
LREPHSQAFHLGPELTVFPANIHEIHVVLPEGLHPVRGPGAGLEDETHELQAGKVGQPVDEIGAQIPGVYEEIEEQRQKDEEDKGLWTELNLS